MKNIPQCITRSALALLAGGLVLTGCASKPKPLSERGWIGGDYVLARHQSALRNFAGDTGVESMSSESLPPAQKKAILLTHLHTNTPAALAGLHERDLIVELDHQPMTSLGQFRRAVDRTPPGTPLPVKVYREGQFMDYTVAVGREKYRSGGNLSLLFPTVVRGWDLWPNPGFSLVFAGYEPDPGVRHELKAQESEVYDQEWSAFLVVMEVNKGQRVKAQELAQTNAPATGQ